VRERVGQRVNLQTGKDIINVKRINREINETLTQIRPTVDFLFKAIKK
jgi:hypothetical protein